MHTAAPLGNAGSVKAPLDAGGNPNALAFGCGPNPGRGASSAEDARFDEERRRNRIGEFRMGWIMGFVAGSVHTPPAGH